MCNLTQPVAEGAAQEGPATEVAGFGRARWHSPTVTEQTDFGTKQAGVNNLLHPQ